MTDLNDEQQLWLNFLKMFTRAMVQINLYEPEHPQVRQTLEEGQILLTGITAGSREGKFSLTIDNDKLIINGSLILNSDKLPNSLKNFFSKFRIQTLSFLSGATKEDLLALCQMQTLKVEADSYLKEHGVEKISVSLEIYAKVDKDHPLAGEAAMPRPADTAEQTPSESLGATLSRNTLDEALSILAARAASDAVEQREITELLSEKIKKEMEIYTSKTFEEIRREKKKTENDMVRTESVISGIADGVVVVDKEGRVLMMNPQAEMISGKPLSELSGKKIFDAIHPENQMMSLTKEIGSENSRDISKDIEKKGGKELSEIIKNSTAIIRNEDGRIVGSVSAPTDAVKLKQVEQLQRDFVANMTHELRSPLTAIYMALNLLAMESGLRDDTKNILNAAIRNSERLNSLITDMLDFSKLQAGKLIFHPEDVSADEIVKEAADAMKSWMDSKNIRLSLIIEPDLNRVYADKRRTVQIIINLISNSIKFTPSGGSIEINAFTGREALAGFIAFSVKDTGCGISKDDLSKIFDQFVQAAVGEKIGGTGLGLAITKAMVIMQGGRITVESEPGKGTAFQVCLPVYRNQIGHSVSELPLAEINIKRAWWRRLLRI